MFVDPKRQAEFSTAAIGRSIWLAASCHPEDEDVALAAQRLLLAEGTNPLLILAPRYPSRTDNILKKLYGFSVKIHSRGELPETETEIYLADSFAEMGLWYASSEQALIGGTFSAVEGHNPWEALQLGCGVMHGPRVENFVTDFDLLRQAKACFAVHNAEDIVAHITSPPTRGLESFERLQYANRSKISNLTDQLLKLIRA